jgi:hypothetical protein
MRDVANCTIGGNAANTGFGLIAARWFNQTAGVNPNRVAELLTGQNLARLPARSVN